MANTTKAQGKIVMEFLSKHGDLPSLTLAKLIYEKHTLEFNSVEGTRTIVRYYRGRLGKSNKKRLSPKGFLDGSDAINFAPFSLPTEESMDNDPIPINGKRVGIISDLHIPNHRNKPIAIAFDYFKAKKVDTIIINGDLLDNTPFTKHDGKRPSAADVRNWFDKGEYFLEYTREMFPDAEIYWLEGNHDFWYRRWMQAHAWQVSEDPYFSLQERLHVDAYKVKYIEQEYFVTLGKLNVCHGHFLVRGIIAPVNAARGVYLKAKKSTLIGHVHVESSHTETDISGDIVTCWSTGSLCTLTPDYMPMGGKACHGFAYVEVFEGGDYIVDNRRIHRGKLL